MRVARLITVFHTFLLLGVASWQTQIVPIRRGSEKGSVHITHCICLCSLRQCSCVNNDYHHYYCQCHQCHCHCRSPCAQQCVSAAAAVANRISAHTVSTSAYRLTCAEKHKGCNCLPHAFPDALCARFGQSCFAHFHGYCICPRADDAESSLVPTPSYGALKL